MKSRHFFKPAVAVIAVAIVVCLGLTAYWKRPLPMLKDPSKLLAAVQAYSQDLMKKKQPVPDSLSLQELVRGGFIAAEDVRAFDGLEVTFFLTADSTRPEEVLIRVRLPDGSQMVVLGDGSVKHLPK